MSKQDEGEPEAEVFEPGERLAPVIPLFGRHTPASTVQETPDPAAPRSLADAERADEGEPRSPAVLRPEPVTWRSTWHDRPGSAADSEEVTSTPAVHQTDDGPLSDLAEKSLLKKLRTRSLSVSEARGVLIAGGLDVSAADDVIRRFEERGYLDDAALAEQIVHIGLDRKGQGRRVIAQTLAKRGVSRSVADAALLALPDDDRERALEFARSKVRSLASVDRDAALRRLVGQLARRGYGGSLALSVAGQALDETSRERSGVRFEED